MYRYFPWLFKIGYVNAENHPKMFNSSSEIYRFLALGASKLHDFISENNIDTVICTHVFAAVAVTEMIKRYPSDITTCFISTDYTCSPIVKETNLDYYLIPHESLMSEFECDNIPKSKMIFGGIPVRSMFFSSVPKKEAKKISGIDSDSKHLLVMCGSMGCGPMKKLISLFSERNPQGTEITVVCGNNAGLMKQLKKRHGKNKNIHIKGYVRDMSTLMDSADLYITKPGGISVSEAALKNLPMVFIDAVAGCEEYNLRHFVDIGGAKTSDNVEGITDVCLSLMENKDELSKMVQCLSGVDKRNSSEALFNIISNRAR